MTPNQLFSPANGLSRSTSVSHGAIARLLQTAEQALERADLKGALENLERAGSLAPATPDILLLLGRAHGLRFDYPLAAAYFEKAVQFSLQKTHTLTKAGANAYTFFNRELAEHYMRRATVQKDATGETWIRLAKFLEGAHRFPESAQCLEQAARLDPASPEIPFVRAKLARHAHHWEEAEKLLRSILPAAGLELRGRCLYELAVVLDRQGRYDDAMATLSDAKTPFQGHRETFRLKRQTLHLKQRKALAGMSAAVMERWSAAGPQLPPARRLALLCGHPRSGTTLLEQVLDSHPDLVSANEAMVFHQEVCVPLAKTRPPEPDEADPATFQLKLETLEAAPIQLLQRLRENYFRSLERCLGEPIAGRLVIDKNPILSMLINGFPRVFPESKLLVALRDPRDVCLSCFMQPLPSRIDIRRTAYFHLSDIVEQYVEEMTLWRTLAPLLQGRYLEVRYEDMVQDLEATARQTFEFLGVPWNPAALRFYERARQKANRLTNYDDVSQPIYQRARHRWRNYEKYFQPHLEKLAPFVKAFGYD